MPLRVEDIVALEVQGRCDGTGWPRHRACAEQLLVALGINEPDRGDMIAAVPVKVKRQAGVGREVPLDGADETQAVAREEIVRVSVGEGGAQLDAGRAAVAGAGGVAEPRLGLPVSQPRERVGRRHGEGLEGRPARGRGRPDAPTGSSHTATISGNTSCTRSQCAPA